MLWRILKFNEGFLQQWVVLFVFFLREDGGVMKEMIIAHLAAEDKVHSIT